MRFGVRGSPFFALGVVAVAGVVWAHSGGIVPAGLRDWAPEWNSGAAVAEAPDAILVVLVPDTDGVDAVRRAVSADRIVASSAGAIALREGRIVAASRDAASELIGRAGWMDAPIQMLAPGTRDAERPNRDSARPNRAVARTNAAAFDEREAELNELAKKPMLSQADAMRALELLD